VPSKGRAEPKLRPFEVISEVEGVLHLPCLQPLLVIVLGVIDHRVSHEAVEKHWQTDEEGESQHKANQTDDKVETSPTLHTWVGREGSIGAVVESRDGEADREIGTAEDDQAEVIIAMLWSIFRSPVGAVSEILSKERKNQNEEHRSHTEAKSVVQITSHLSPFADHGLRLPKKSSIFGEAKVVQIRPNSPVRPFYPNIWPLPNLRHRPHDREDLEQG
jgi:hypothetical protein